MATFEVCVSCAPHASFSRATGNCLLGSAAWFATVITAPVSSIRTRLGYLVVGLLSWATLGFCLPDNSHVAFQTSLVGEEPGLGMAVRGLAGVAATTECATTTVHRTPQDTPPPARGRGGTAGGLGMVDVRQPWPALLANF